MRLHQEKVWCNKTLTFVPMTTWLRTDMGSMSGEENDVDLPHNHRDYSNRCLYSIVRPLFGATGGEGRCKKLWWSGGSWGEGKKYSKGLSESPSVGPSVGGEGEGGRDGGVDDAVSCKKAPSSAGRSDGHVRHPTLKRRRRRRLLNIV